MALVTSLKTSVRGVGARGRQPYMVETTLDFSNSAINSLSAGDIVQAISVPANTMVMTAGAEMIEAVQTAADGNTVNLGFTGSGSQIGGTDVSGYVSNVDIDDNATNLSSGIGYLTPASTAANPVICTAEDTIDLELQATSTAPNAGLIRIFAVLMNIDSLGELGADEVDRDTLA
jgi:hypothetical protein